MPFDGTKYTLGVEYLLGTPSLMIAWLRSKTPEENVASSRADVRDCMLGRFLAEHGSVGHQIGGLTYWDAHGVARPIPAWFVSAWLTLPGDQHNRIPFTAAQALDAFAKAGLL